MELFSESVQIGTMVSGTDLTKGLDALINHGLNPTQRFIEKLTEIKS